MPDNADALINETTAFNLGFGTIKSRPGALSADDSTRWVIAGTANSACLNASSINWSTNWVNVASYLTPNAINPNSVHLRGGPYSVDITITHSFSNNIRIPSGGELELVVASSWGHWIDKTY